MGQETLLKFEERHGHRLIWCCLYIWRNFNDSVQSSFCLYIIAQSVLIGSWFFVLDISLGVLSACYSCSHLIGFLSKKAHNGAGSQSAAQWRCLGTDHRSQEACVHLWMAPFSGQSTCGRKQGAWPLRCTLAVRSKTWRDDFLQSLVPVSLGCACT